MDEVVSMSPEQASNRLIRPEEQVYAGGAVSSTMFEHVPSSKLIGMEDFVDDAQYYDKYQRLMPRVSAIQTLRMDPQDAEAFSLMSWQNALVALKAFASERVSELRTSHEGDHGALAKINACSGRISGM